MNEPWMHEMRADMKAVLQRLTQVETRLETIYSSSDPVRCALHDNEIRMIIDRLQKLERIQGRENLLRITLGAIGAGVVFGMKYLVGLFPKIN